MIAVTNIAAGFSREISSLTKRSNCSNGTRSRRARLLARVLVRAIKSDAGTPLPETSPIIKHKRMLVEHKRIIQVAADFLRRLQQGVEINGSRQAFDGAGIRQHAHLNFARRAQLPVHTQTLHALLCQNRSELAPAPLRRGKSGEQ